jgi:hypothetical protein
VLQLTAKVEAEDKVKVKVQVEERKIVLRLNGKTE